MSSSSVYFSTTGMMLRPIFWASIAISMNSASLKPLQMMGVLLSASATTASSSGLEPASRPKSNGRAELEHFLDDLPLLVDLDRVDADVAALVLVLGDGRLEGVVDVLQPVLEDVAEADERRQVDAAALQVVDQLLEVDGPVRVLRGMHLDVAVLADREVALAPALDFVQLGGVGGRPALAHVVRGARASHRNFHYAMIPKIRGRGAACYQIFTRSEGGRYNLSPGLRSNAA